MTRTREALGDVPGMAEFVGTIHAFCLELLKSELPEFLKFGVLNEVQQSLFVDRHSTASGLTSSTDLAGAPLRRYRDTRNYTTALGILREADRVDAALANCSVLGGSVTVALKGVALFDRKRKSTEYKQADSGYIAAWYLDEDYDGDCFVDCQVFFDFKKKPALKKLGIDVAEDEFELKLTSEPFTPGGYKRLAIKVVDVYGNELVLVKELV